MGRYYHGDIEGKFWFAVQNSDDASFFGGQELDSGEINYIFDKADLPDIESGIAKCIENLNGYRFKLDEFFSSSTGYNDQMVADALGIAGGEVHDLLVWYARLELGRKILACVNEKGTCEFTAEC